MSLDDLESNEIFHKFNDLIQECYDGSLKAFSDDFSDGDSHFYEKLKKEIQRSKAGKLTIRKKETFKKYIFFLEYKLWEKNSTDKSLKKFDRQIDSLIDVFCKGSG